MKTSEQIKQRIKEIEGDKVYNGPPVCMFTNTRLAVLQAGMEIELETLKWVLGEIDG